MDRTPAPRGEDSQGTPRTLSTGETVTPPLRTEATITGTVLGASRDRVRELLPTGLTPIRAGPSRSAVTFLCVEYHRLGDEVVDPYNEFGVVIPATHASTGAVPVVSVFTRGVSGYVWYLPVTTEPARALGEEIWGYPKDVGDIAHADAGKRRRTTVTVDGQHVVTLDIARPPTVALSTTGYSYTVKDCQLLREPLELDGDMGFRPFSTEVAYEFGDHPRTEKLRRLELGNRALLRFFVDGDFVIHEGKPVTGANKR